MNRRWEHALVTGGSSGIGLAIARQLADQGTSLTLLARNAERLERCAEALRSSTSVTVKTVAADLATLTGIESAAQALIGSDPPVDLLVNNAAAGAPAALVDRLDVTGELTVGVTAVGVLTHRAVQAMVARGVGTVINVASGTAQSPIPYAAPYGASKAFVVSLSEAVDFELRGTGVRVLVVCPGFTDTGAVERTGGDGSKVPAFLKMSPEEVARRSLTAARRGKGVSHPGWANRAGATLGRHLPHALVLRAAAAQQRRIGAARPGRPGLGRDGHPT